MILELLKRVCESLDNKNIPYMISGSIALNIYTIPRMTRDIDIVVELSDKQVNEFISLFPDSYYDEGVIRDEIKRQGMFNIIDHATGFKIDFIIRKESDYHKLAFSRRRKLKELNTELWVISIEDLIIAKIIWIQQFQSEKQMNDTKNLILNPDIDMPYIISWCQKLKLDTFNLISNE